MASEPHSWSEIAGPTTDPRGVSTRLLARSKQLWQVLEYSSAYLALLAVAEVLVVQYLLGLGPSPAALVVGLLTFSVYANDRLVDVETDARSKPRRTAFVREYRRGLFVFAAAAYGLAVALALLGGPLVFGLALLPGAAWVLYALDWVPSVDVRFGRLKEVLGVNSAVVAVAYTLTVVFLPLSFAGGALSPAVGVVFLYFVLSTFVDVEVANAYDVESDRESGVTTIPVAIGVKRTRHVLYGVIALATGVLGYGLLAGYLSSLAVGALSLGLLYLLVIVSLLGRVGSGTSLPVVAECSRLPVFLALAASAFAM